MKELSIGAKHSCFVIAEIGMNHNGDLDLAKAMIKSAAECGASAVKFQIFKAEKFVAENALVYGENSHSEPVSQVEMLKKYEFSYDEWKLLKDTAAKEGIIFFASAFDEESIKVVNSLDVELFKIASCDLTNLPLIRQIGSCGKATFMSTGMSTLSEIDIAVRTFLKTANRNLVLMHCISSYPANIADSNIAVIQSLQTAFGLPVGFSDHCKENYASFGAVVLGSVAIEKHFTIDNKLPGIDQEMSLNPEEFAKLVEGIKAIRKSIGVSTKTVLESEKPARTNGRRSIMASCDIPVGVIINQKMLTIKRPGTGLSPIYYDFIIGKKASQLIKKDELLTWEKL